VQGAAADARDDLNLRYLMSRISVHNDPEGTPSTSQDIHAAPVLASSHPGNRSPFKIGKQSLQELDLRCNAAVESKFRGGHIGHGFAVAAVGLQAGLPFFGIVLQGKIVSRLDGAIQRLARANQHIKALEHKVTKIAERQPYRHRIHPYRTEKIRLPDDAEIPAGLFSAPVGDPTRVALVPGAEVEFVREFGIRLTITQKLDGLVLGAAIGDVIHNLRAALDYIVWELSDTQVTAPTLPIPFGSPWRRVQFPVVMNQGQWATECGRRLHFVDPTLHATFKRLQPFHTHRQHPQRSLLAVLDELCNRDKHRSIVVVEDLVRFERVDPSQWDFGGSRPAITDAVVLRHRRSGAVKDGAELARIRLNEPEATSTLVHVLQDALDLNLDFAYDVAFEKGFPAHGRRVVELLGQLSDCVAAILWKFDPLLS
jgi:hypothetical protein